LDGEGWGDRRYSFPTFLKKSEACLGVGSDFSVFGEKEKVGRGEVIDTSMSTCSIGEGGMAEAGWGCIPAARR
jgi:hypothetical protein